MAHKTHLRLDGWEFLTTCGLSASTDFITDDHRKVTCKRCLVRVPAETHQANYSKRFLSGDLKGRLYHCTKRFSSLQAAEAFVNTANDVKTDECGETFVVEDATVIDLAEWE